ncbi:hypothetical protein [Trichocoleus sp. Lan]
MANLAILVWMHYGLTLSRPQKGVQYPRWVNSEGLRAKFQVYCTPE